MLNQRTKGLITTRFHSQPLLCWNFTWWNFVDANFHYGEISWCEFSPQQNFSKTKFHFSGCEISPRWQQNFSWLNKNSWVLTKLCRIFARTKDKIYQISLSFLLPSTVILLCSTNLIQTSMLMLKLMCQLVLNRVWQIFRCTFMNGSNNGGSWTEGHHCQRKEISCQVGLWT